MEGRTWHSSRIVVKKSKRHGWNLRGGARGAPGMDPCLDIYLVGHLTLHPEELGGNEDLVFVQEIFI
jgi:hypothetical protein